MTGVESKKWRRQLDRRGFTLIELMLVVVLLGILAAVIVPRFAGRSRQAAEAAARTDIVSSLGVAIDLYELDNGDYPSTEQGLVALVEEPRSGRQAPQWNGPYVKSVQMQDPWGNPYHYEYPGRHNRHSYDLWSLGPDGRDGTEDDITNW